MSAIAVTPEEEQAWLDKARPAPATGQYGSFTVAELIEALKKFPPGMRVMTRDLAAMESYSVREVCVDHASWKGGRMAVFLDR